MLLYDNLDDTQAKLSQTICMYDGNAVQVREIGLSDMDGKKPYTMLLKAKHGKHISTTIDDPKFEFRHFKLGYANQGSVVYWWFRRALKQYRQGLRSDQVANLYSDPAWYGGARWDFNGSIINMLEGTYPDKEKCAKALVDGDVHAMAFHRDFALSYDHLHRDLIIEYRGKKIGQTTNFKDFHLLDEYKHLTEAFMEAMAN